MIIFPNGVIFVLFSLTINGFLLPIDTWKQLKTEWVRQWGKWREIPLGHKWISSTWEILILPNNIYGYSFNSESQEIGVCPFSCKITSVRVPWDVLNIHNILNYEFPKNEVRSLWLSSFSIESNCHVILTIFQLIKMIIYSLNYLWGNKLTLNPPKYGANL